MLRVMANNGHKRHLSQFFTPPIVVKFMYDLVGFDPLWKVIDPACGDGAFLTEALRRGAAAVAGIDKDPDAVESARKNLASYEGRFKLFRQDGLEEIESDSGFWKGHYDLVIGNPPFASSRYRIRDKTILRHFTLAQKEDLSQALTLPGFDEELLPTTTRISQIIEILFLERFTQLLRPGGRVAIILPEGVFANSNLRYVRAWLIENFTIQAVIGLPRDTFKATGTAAKTAILYLEKSKPPAKHQVLLSEVGKLNYNDNAASELETVLSAFQRLRSEPLTEQLVFA